MIIAKFVAGLKCPAAKRRMVECHTFDNADIEPDIVERCKKKLHAWQCIRNTMRG